jgi:hypothetical protein
MVSSGIAGVTSKSDSSSFIKKTASPSSNLVVEPTAPGTGHHNGRKFLLPTQEWLFTQFVLFDTCPAPNRQCIVVASIFQCECNLELTIFYHLTVIGPVGTAFACSGSGCNGAVERDNEDLPADNAARYPVGGGSPHVGTGTAVGNSSPIAFLPNSIPAHGLPKLERPTHPRERGDGRARGNIPFPVRISCTRLLGTPDSSLSSTPAWICVGARPPLVARIKTRIAGAVTLA